MSYGISCVERLLQKVYTELLLTKISGSLLKLSGKMKFLPFRSPLPSY